MFTNICFRMGDMISTISEGETMNKRKEWRCDTCDLKGVCNRYEAQAADTPIIFCSKYVQEREEDEEDDVN